MWYNGKEFSCAQLESPCSPTPLTVQQPASGWRRTGEHTKVPEQDSLCKTCFASYGLLVSSSAALVRTRWRAADEPADRAAAKTVLLLFPYQANLPNHALAVQAIPIVSDQSNRFIFDHAALQRFAIPLSALPPDSMVNNRQESAWERYRARSSLSAWGLPSCCSLWLSCWGDATPAQYRGCTGESQC